MALPAIRSAFLLRLWSDAFSRNNQFLAIYLNGNIFFSQTR